MITGYMYKYAIKYFKGLTTVTHVLDTACDISVNVCNASDQMRIINISVFYHDFGVFEFSLQTFCLITEYLIVSNNLQ